LFVERYLWSSFSIKLAFLLILLSVAWNDIVHWRPQQRLALKDKGNILEEVHTPIAVAKFGSSTPTLPDVLVKSGEFKFFKNL
jgi:hypothetical protein